MTPSDHFKAQLKAGNIPEALSLALNGAVDLKITTWVTSANDSQQTAPTQPGYRLRTRINTIEGKVDNEIGDQFIGNGPYRELQQFHSEQVAQGREIINSNLKSLQTLFEVVIAMQKAQRRIATLPQSTLPLVFEPESPEVEQLLPPAQENLETPTSKEVEDLAPAPLALPNVPATFVSIPVPTPEALTEEEDEEDDHWDDDDSVLDLLESLPVGEQASVALDSPEAEDWRNFIEEEDAPAPPKLDLDSEQDWGILSEQDFAPPSTDSEPPAVQGDLGELIKDEPELEPSADVLASQNWEKLSFEDLQPPTAVEPSEIKANNADDDWGDLVEDEVLTQPRQAVPSLESLNLEAEEEWEDWVIESEPLQDSPIQRLESLDLEDDHGWDDFEEADPFAATPTNLASALQDDADWDNFDTDELEPYTGLLELDTNIGTGFDLSGEFEGLTAGENNENRLSGLSKPSEQDANDLMAVLFGDEPQEQEPKAQKTEEELFADMQFEEFLAKGHRVDDDLKTRQQSESENAEADLEQPPSDKKIVPPPPPSHLPNKNNYDQGG